MSSLLRLNIESVTINAKLEKDTTYTQISYVRDNRNIYVYSGKVLIATVKLR